MATGSFRKRWSSLLAAFLAASLGTCCAFAEAPRRILILDSFGRDIAPFNTAVSTFRTTLARELGGPVDIYEASLDAARFAEPEKETPFVEFLKSRFEGRSLDLIVPVGAPAARLISKQREALFPKIPVVFTGVDPRMLPAEALRTNATLATQRVNLSGILEDMLLVRPDTTNIAVVFGASPLEKFWVNECHREFLSFTNRVGFTWLNDLPLDRIQERVAALPSHSFIMFGMFVTDAAGVPYDNDDALRRLHMLANAPVYGYFASELGFGAIGGRLYQDSEVGARAAHAAIRILHGERAESVPPQILELAVPTYDWRELRHWGIPEARLPAGSIIQFRQPTPWEVYRWRIIAIVSVCVLQTGLILILLLNRARRRRAEEAARDLSRRLLHAHEEERARLARDLHDDVTQRLARLAIDAGLVERGVNVDAPGEIMRSVRDGLVRLSEDVHALSYRLHPSVLEDLGLAEALKAECERFSRQEAIPSDVKLGELPVVIPRESALCLFRVAQAALRNVARHAKARGVQVLLRGMDGGVQLAVRDDGIGFDPTAENHRGTLGLASMDERVHLAGGELDVESAPGHGTTIVAWVPVEKG